MKTKNSLNQLSRNFAHEKEDLHSRGIKTWEELQKISDSEISTLTREGRSSSRNLRRIRGIASLVCKLSIEPHEAALLIHSGISSISALINSSPQDVVLKTGRLRRQLKSDLTNSIDLVKANEWIQRARDIKRLG